MRAEKDTVMPSQESEKWQEVKDLLGQEQVCLGPYFSYQLRHSPRRILFMLSRYKFAAKMIGENRKVLEVGCSEGLGTVLLGEFSEQVLGIDLDEDSISWAKRNFANEKMQFQVADIFTLPSGEAFDGVLSFDVIEHIFPEHEEAFWQSLRRQLDEDGVCIVGTPNVTADAYASAVAKHGHVNMFDWQRLQQTMQRHFKQVFIFSANDEMIHTGFYPLAHYLIGVGVGKKE